MREYLPILIVGAIIGVFTAVFVAAYVYIRSRREHSFDRSMADGEIVVRLLRYAKPFWKNFAVVLVIMLFSIARELDMNAVLMTSGDDAAPKVKTIRTE